MPNLPHIYTRSSFRDLTPDELSLLFDAQREIIRVGGTLGLTDDLEFIIASGVGRGLLAVRNDGDGQVWIQIAYVDPIERRRGIFRAMVDVLATRCPGKRIGLGTDITNTTMQAAAFRTGFKQEKVYLYREPAHV